MARTKKSETADQDQSTSTHEHWNNESPHSVKGKSQTYAEAAGPLAPGRCRCTSVEHDLGEPGCETAPGGDGEPV
jgi:hypothetical protein